MQSEHLRHDRLLIARYAADDSYPTEVEEARAQIEACTECAAIANDIRLVSRAMATIPVPTRPRDFRITAEQAERLRGSWLERVMRRFAGPGLGALRPVAGVALSIGLVMAVAGALPTFAPAGPAAEMEIGFPTATQGDAAAAPDYSPEPPQEGSSSGADPSPAAAMESTSGEPMRPDINTATDNGGRGHAEGPESSAKATLEPITQRFDDAYNATPDAGTESEQQESTDLRTSATSTSTILTYGGLLIAAASLGVLIVAGLARRRFSDRLLR